MTGTMPVDSASAVVDEAVPRVIHIVKGQAMTAAETVYGEGDGRFATPRLVLEELVWPRSELPPAFDTPVAEIVDLLVATGERLREDPSGLLAEAFANSARTNPTERGVLERAYQSLWRSFTRETIEFQLERELGGAAYLDGWQPVPVPDGRVCHLRAYPPRLVHVLAGNSPGPSAGTVVKAALTKGVHLLKMPSNDLYTAPAVLRTMAEIAPDHPVVRSFSAVYWRGGDESVESVLFRPQFFDKLVAWGGEASIRSAVRYIGPGFELVTFDPKNSISLIGKEAFASPEALAEAADAAAADATIFNQASCVASRVMFIEGDEDDADAFAEAMLPRMAVERHSASVVGPVPPSEVQVEVEALRALAPMYRVFGRFDGRGVVVRSDEPVDFYPDGKLVNLVPVDSLRTAATYANVSTQTVGVYPASRAVEVRDVLVAAGVQRVVALGSAGRTVTGLARDNFLPLHRFVRWVNDES